MTNNRIKKTYNAGLLIVLPLLALCAACSTRPKNNGDTFELRNQAESRLELGNRDADRGNYENARIVLAEARRIAIITDDPSLRIRCALSLGNVLFMLGNGEEAIREGEAALAEAELEGNRELEAVSRIHLARFRLLSGLSPAQTVRSEAAAAIDAVRSDDLYTALGWLVVGLAEKELGRYSEAESALRRSLAIHEKKRALEQAAYDWFLIASFRSLAGNFEGARIALTEAVKLDRRVENSYGLATDWRAMGDIYKKAGNPEESRAAYLRSGRIFRSLGNDTAALETESRIPSASS